MRIFGSRERDRLEKRGGIHVDTTRKTRSWSLTISTGDDGTTRERCWFCGGELAVDLRDARGGAATVMIQPLGEGDAMHGVRHQACALRAKHSLAT
jgi:hypothetical protein